MRKIYKIIYILYMLNGITFSIPEEKIVKDIPNKSKIC